MPFVDTRDFNCVHWRSSLTQLRTIVIKREITLFGKIDFPYQKELLLKERIRSHWEQILSFREAPILKRDAIEETH